MKYNIPNLPILIQILFIVTTFFAVWQFFKASNKSKIVLTVLIVWMAIQGLAAFIGFYQDMDAFPPRFIFLVLPAFLTIIIMFLTKKGRQFIDHLNIQDLTWLHIVRIPVEISLYYLFIAKLVPKLMTFEGFNFDIISGISAPIIYYFVFKSKKLGNKALLAWNFICLGLLINIVIIAILSGQTPIQQLAFDQPNIAVTYFPFVWLPSVIVSLVLFSHLIAIRKIILEL